jgi:hypothetical protein
MVLVFSQIKHSVFNVRNSFSHEFAVNCSIHKWRIFKNNSIMKLEHRSYRLDNHKYSNKWINKMYSKHLSKIQGKYKKHVYKIEMATAWKCIQMYSTKHRVAYLKVILWEWPMHQIIFHGCGRSNCYVIYEAQ